MNFHPIFVLAVSLLSVVFAQQNNYRAQQTYDEINQSFQQNEDADKYILATLALKHGFNKGLKSTEKSLNTFYKGISEAEKSIDNLEASKKLMDKTFELVFKQFCEAIPSYFQSFGEALALSNVGTAQGLMKATVLLQKAGFSVFDQLQNARNLFDFGFDAKELATEILFQAVRLTVETGFAGYYVDTQESIKIADKTLRDVDRAGPSFRPVKATNCDVAEHDSEISYAVNEINKAANNALTRGADPDQVEEYRDAVICALGDVIVAADKVKEFAKNLEQLAESDYKVGEGKCLNTIESVKDEIFAAAAKIFIAIGDIAYDSDNELADEIGEALLTFEQGKIKTIKSIDAAASVLDVGLRYKGDTPSVTVDAVKRIVYFAKLAFVQGLVNSVKIVLNVI